MTDLDDTPARRRTPRRLPWILASVALGALIGAGGGLYARHRDLTSVDPTATTLAAPDAVSVPVGLIGGRRPATRPPTHTIDNRVFIVGDSVMQGASPYLTGGHDGWSLTIDTRVGRFIDEANQVIRKRRSKIGEIAVLNLGNNYGGDRTAFAASVETTLTLLTGVDHVIWVNVSEFPSAQAEVNQVLIDAATRHPNLTIVDWNSWWTQHREFTGGDHLHLTPDGAKAYASLVALAIKQVTDEAGEIPAPGASAPSVNTSGTIPTGSGSATTPRKRPTVTRSPTTAPTRSTTGASVTTAQTEVTTPATTPATAPVTAPVTTPTH